jgi:hypothetical protein
MRDLFFRGFRPKPVYERSDRQYDQRNAQYGTRDIGNNTDDDVVITGTFDSEPHHEQHKSQNQAKQQNQ